MRAVLILVAALAVATPVMAAPNAQLVASVQRAMDFGGFRRMNTRSRVKVILDWD